MLGSLSSIGNTKRFELGWWGEGSLEAVTIVNSLARPGDTVLVDFAPGHTVPSFKEEVKSIRRWQGKADFVIVNLFALWYGDADQTFDYINSNNMKLVYEVKIAGEQTIVWVYAK